MPHIRPAAYLVRNARSIGVCVYKRCHHLWPSLVPSGTMQRQSVVLQKKTQIATSARRKVRLAVESIKDKINYKNQFICVFGTFVCVRVCNCVCVCNAHMYVFDRFIGKNAPVCKLNLNNVHTYIYIFTSTHTCPYVIYTCMYKYIYVSVYA